MRSTALEVLSELHESGTSLEASVYDQASLALNDDYERVRTAAIRVVCVQSLSNADRSGYHSSSPLLLYYLMSLDIMHQLSTSYLVLLYIDPILCLRNDFSTNCVLVTTIAYFLQILLLSINWEQNRSAKLADRSEKENVFVIF